MSVYSPSSPAANIITHCRNLRSFPHLSNPLITVPLFHIAASEVVFHVFNLFYLIFRLVSINFWTKRTFSTAVWKCHKYLLITRCSLCINALSKRSAVKAPSYRLLVYKNHNRASLKSSGCRFFKASKHRLHHSFSHTFVTRQGHNHHLG